MLNKILWAVYRETFGTGGRSYRWAAIHCGSAGASPFRVESSTTGRSI